MFLTFHGKRFLRFYLNSLNICNCQTRTLLMNSLIYKKNFVSLFYDIQLDLLYHQMRKRRSPEWEITVDIIHSIYKRFVCMLFMVPNGSVYGITVIVIMIVLYHVYPKIKDLKKQRHYEKQSNTIKMEYFRKTFPVCVCYPWIYCHGSFVP